MHRLPSGKIRSLLRPVKRVSQKSRRGKRVVRVTSKAFGLSTWKGGTAITGNEDHRGEAGLGVKTGSEVLDMFSLRGILT